MVSRQVRSFVTPKPRDAPCSVGCPIVSMVPGGGENECAAPLICCNSSRPGDITNVSRPSGLPSGVGMEAEEAALCEDEKNRRRYIGRTMDGVVHAISLVVETRDPYTAGHQRRVAELARAIAVEMGLARWQAKGVHVTGLLHDVGKIGVPSEILSKPGRISQHEFSIIKSHCQIGWEILRRIEFPWPVVTAVLQHHERLDGSGYPRGLSGEDIILEARILGVADVVEAMSSNRPYRLALGLKNALAEISRASGALYDPAVVDACLGLLMKDETEFDRLMAAADGVEYVTTAEVD
jgi:putative nucleotidyltransferase with HDIG domain